MSFILDALKKSESERQRQAGPALLEMRIIPPSHRLPAWAIVVGAILLASVGVLGWLALRAHPAPASAALHAAVPSTATAPVAAAAQPSAVQSASPATQVEQPSADVGAPPVPARLTPPVASGNAIGNDDAGDTTDADNEPAIAPQPDSSAGGNNAPKLRNYAEVNGTVPELRLDLHVYSTNPAERYAFINMRKVREGDTTPEGAHVQQITRDGVVLEYNGREFVLGH